LVWVSLFSQQLIHELIIACARDYLYSHSPHLPPDYSYAQDGPPSSPTLPSPPIIILALHPHYSILKAASLVGIGAGPRVVHTIPASQEDELAFDMAVLRDRLEKEKEVGRGVIVSYGLGEVNTGGTGSDLEEVAELCEELGAWLHVDAGMSPLWLN
jgi:glutamate/tyrosine decarboxylase-like PLP-dependent enzyme